jgi:hypothetical protein
MLKKIKRNMGVTHLEFVVVSVEASWAKEESCDRSPRVICVPNGLTHVTQLC